MQRIIPHLWFDTQAREAADFYTKLFPESRIDRSSMIRDTPSGDCDIVTFTLWGLQFAAISAGPYFKPNPSISFMVNFDPSRDPEARERIDDIWEQLVDGGKVLMPLDRYPFSERYGWVDDRYGISWQLILTDPNGEPRPPIMPAFMFAGELYGKAKEASDLYLSIFPNSARGVLVPYGADQPPNEPGATMFTDFRLDDVWCTAIDAAGEHKFSFSEAVSLMVPCETQEEIDRYWEQLSAVPEAEQCGWLKDKYGVSWQIVPRIMDEIQYGDDEAKKARVVKAFLPMKKMDIAAIEKAAGE